MTATATREATLKRSDGMTIKATIPAPNSTPIPTGMLAGRMISDRERNTAPAAAPIRRFRLG